MVINRVVLQKKLEEKGLTPEQLAHLSDKAFSNMTVRRALKGKGTDRLKVKAMASKDFFDTPRRIEQDIMI